MNSELIDKVYESCFAQQVEELDELFFLQVMSVEYDTDGSHRGACFKRQVRRRTLSSGIRSVEWPETDLLGPQERRLTLLRLRVAIGIPHSAPVP